PRAHVDPSTMPFMLASFPAGTVNQKIADLGILNDSKHFHPALGILAAFCGFVTWRYLPKAF
ncbi:hypothetical protein, partial [Mesorhizobium sp. M2A.F.Ca.ET.042.01.1.1]|uniref:hypothetical protein n=1 Tax=Mesorhizobium sp. M2A.F.Ca.ET.042.01.1.1 TaxID=2496745 RepID=UPI001AED0B70